MTKPKLVLFGLNADPPHLGHLKVINEVKKHFDPQALFVVVPSGIHPHQKKQNASFNDRLQMTKLLFQGCEHVIVDNYEGHVQKTSYTLDTLKYLHAKYKTHELYFIIATDVANLFYSWYEPNHILALAIPIIVTRQGHPLNPQFLKHLQDDTRPLVLKTDSLDVSSTKIRQQIKNNQVPDSLSNNVWTYIQEKGLYH